MSESAKQPLVIFTYVVLMLSTLLVYWQVGSFDFIGYDDDKYVSENPHVLNGLSSDGIVWAFTTSHASNWHPLTWLSHMLDCRLFGIKPGGMHLVNVLLHLASTLLLFAVLRRMTGALWSSAFVAAAFALHPMHVESVAWIAERKDVLSTLFLLLTLAAYVGYAKRPSVFRYLLALVLFGFGLLAKPMLVTLPFLLLLLDYWPLNRISARTVAEKIPFLVLAAASSVITFLVQQSGGSVVNISPLKDRLANSFLSYAGYTGRMLWPHDMAVFYPFDAGGLASWQVAMCVLLLLVISAFVIRLGRSQRYLPVGWFWFVGTLVPVIGFVQVGRQAFADRYTYIPYIGLFIMIAWGLPALLAKWPFRKLTLGISAVIALAALGVCAHQQAGCWKNSIAVFSHAIDVTKDNYVAYNGRGAAYVNLCRNTEAIKDFTEAIRINPDYAEAHNGLGVVYCKLGRSAESIKDFTEAIRIKPDDATPYNNLGVAYRSLGRRQDAIDAHRQAIRIDPDCFDARYNLADELVAQGIWNEAIDQYREVLRLRPDWLDCMNNLALLIATGPQVKARDADEAVGLAARACRLTDNRNPVYLGTLAAAYASAGRFSEAVDTADRAMKLADAANQPRLKDAIRYQLSFYTQGKPYIEPRRM